MGKIRLIPSGPCYVGTGLNQSLSELGDGQDASTQENTPAGSGGIADPTQLPTAAGQSPQGGAYDAFEIDTQAAGYTYNDPNSNVLIIKLTSATYPVANGHCPSFYAMFGPCVSLPWGANGVMRTVMVVPDYSGPAYLIDVNTSTGAVSNERSWATPGTRLNTHYCGLFSYNTSTPQIAYSRDTSNRIARYDTNANALANTGNFPLATTAWTFGALSMSVDDRYFMTCSDGNGFQIWDHVTGKAAIRTKTDVSINQGEIGRAAGGTYVFGARTDGTLAWIYNRTADTYVNPACDSGDHICTIGASGYAAFKNQASGQGAKTSTLNLATGAINSYLYGAGETEKDYYFGQWALGNTDAWFGMEKDQSSSSFVSLGNVAGDTERLLCYHYNAQTQYSKRPHAFFSGDGKVVVFATDMNGAGALGRVDLFMAVMPTS